MPNIIQENAHFLDNDPLWAALTAEERQTVQKESTIVRYGKNEQIYREEDIPEAVMMLVSGKVRIYKEGIGQRPQIIRMLMQPWMPGQKIPTESLQESLKVLDLARKDRSTISDFISDYDLFGGNMIWPARKIPELQHLVKAVLELKDKDIVTCATPADLYKLVQSRVKHLKRNAVNEICFVLTMNTENNGGK